MRSTILLCLAIFLSQVTLITAQTPADFSTNNVFSIRDKASVNGNFLNSFRFTSGNTAQKPNFSNLLSAKKSSAAGFSADCDDFDVVFAPAAAPCNGVSVTSVNFFKSQRTVVSGTDNTVDPNNSNNNVVYRYSNVGTAPDGTVLDALVTVTNYSNNQDSTPTTFRDADLFVNPANGTNVGFDNNLQPSLEPENDLLSSAAAWSGSITYKIQFVRTGTNVLKRISVAPITLDNDGSNICGGLRETVTYSPEASQAFTLNQTLINNPANSANFQVQSGNSFTPNNNSVQTGIGSGINYASAALFVNVTELSWTYSFQTTGACTAGGNSEDRFGSLNMSCQIDFQKSFVSYPVSGNVYNDTDGLTDNQVDGTGTNAGGLFANLLDANGTVFASATVAADGTYNFPTVVPGSYTVQVSTNQGIESNPAPVRTLPSGWTITGEFLGTGTGSDGTVDGLLAVTVTNAAVANANFGIEQRPTTTNSSVANQANPGGTNNVTVPAANFVTGDLSGGTVSNIRITAFPSNATSITINGTAYTSANFPAGGVTVPVSAGVPTQAITVDPIDGTVTVGIPFIAIDNAGVRSLAPSIVNVPFGGPSISGTVFNDVNGLTDSTVNGNGTNAGGPLYAVLVNGGGNVVQSVLLSSGGNYSFPNVAAGTYTVRLSTVAGTIGSAAPAVSLPAGWVSTGEFLGTGTGNDGTPANTQLTVTVAADNVTNANFGIEQRPTANDSTLLSQTKPTGTTNVTVPAVNFSASDPVSSTISSIRITALPTGATSITINGVLYGTGGTAFPAGGVTVPTNAAGNPTQTITVDPLDSAAVTEVKIPYVAIDQAGVASSATATVTIPFGSASISGTVFNDVNGLTDSTVNGIGTNAGTLYAILVNTSNNTITQSVSVNADGTYSFSGVAAGNYTVQLSATAGTVGAVAPATATLPAGWVNTAQYPSLEAGNDGVNDGKLSPFAIAAGTNVVNANFGIEQPPTANNNTAASQNNPGGTNNATVPATAFSGTDPVTNTVSNIRITALPTGATSITINGVLYGTGGTAFPAGGVTVPTNAAGNPTQTILVDPSAAGATNVVITYVTIDQAGVESAATATATVPFALAPTSASGEISGRLHLGGQPVRNALVVLTDLNSGAKAVVRTNVNGEYRFAGKESGKTYVVQPLSSKYAFNPSTLIVNLLDSAVGQNFDTLAKAYRPKNDFDGDGKTDIGVFRPLDGNWYILKSSDDQMSVFNFGTSGDVPVSGDFDGDGKTDYAVFRPTEGIWYIWQSATQNLRAERFGQNGDKIVPADFDGDGKTDIAVYRAGFWYIRRSSDDAFEARHYGETDDTPMIGDFNGDRKADFSVYRPSAGTWFTLYNSTDNSSARRFGIETDVALAEDFDGDGLTDIAQFRNGSWYILNSTTDFEAAQFGWESDKLAVGDYDGDGRADIAIFRDGLWVIRNSDGNAVRYFNFGSADDVPLK